VHSTVGNKPEVNKENTNQVSKKKRHCKHCIFLLHAIFYFNFVFLNVHACANNPGFC